MLPTLATFATHASWRNRAGRPDRSACIELKASDLWPNIPPEDWQPSTRRVVGKSHLLAHAQTYITAHHLADLHDHKHPITLIGDQRTHKSNALRTGPSNTHPAPGKAGFSTPSLTPHPLKTTSPHHADGGHAGVTSKGTSEAGPASGPASGGKSGGNSGGGGTSGEANPNKGNTRTKMLGLPTDWSQDLTVQRWRLHEKLAQHFFASPRCAQRALKLFLPLCTPEELRDALTAQTWLESHHQRIARSTTLRPQAAQLSHRYNALFAPRTMLCRTCLHLRYGYVRIKPT